jgi:adenylate cyclase
MSFLETVERARGFLERNARISIRALQREFDLDPEDLEALIEELTEIQEVAVREGRALSWAGRAPVLTPLAISSEPERAPRTYTPKHLAEKILRSKSAVEGERKQVTVLFADVAGSMQLAGQLDPEAWHEILERFFEILTEGVHRFEGTVNQYTGDGIMALFGAPIAHEDHAQRACYAALALRGELDRYADELRRTRGVSLSTRIGINSGDVVVGKIGDDLRMDYTAQGHTVGLAQRVEQCAAADSAYLTAYTARLVEGYFELRDLGDFDLKGVEEPLRVHELVGVGALRTRLDSSRSRGFSKFVGRDAEMANLESALENTLRGEGQVVGVVAEAGTGKSRLCFEFVERCRARGIRVNQAHCPAHGETVSYLALLEMLRDIFGIDARDSDHEARRKIAGELMLLDESFQGLLPVLFEFMGVADPAKPAPEMGPEARQRKLQAFVRHLVQARSESEPTVLFLDDLHWIDPGSDAFLAQAVEATAQTQTLFLVNFRPEYEAEWMKKSIYQQLPLRPLGGEAINALLADLLGNDPSVTDLPKSIHERTGGNPFFIEEIIQSLIENGSLQGSRGAHRLVTSAETLELPTTVHSVLAARLDRLPEREKRLLQTASVIGKEFAASLLQRVIEASGSDALGEAEFAAALEVLASSEFIFEASLYPEVEYAFKHPLTQEVAYTSQLSGRRRTLHSAVGRALEAQGADKLDEHAALLGYHWEQAGAAIAAAQWYARAATVAGFDSPVEALRHWERVREILESEPSPDSVALRLDALSQLFQFGWRLGMTAERGEELFEEAKSLAIDRGDVRTQLRLYYARGLGFATDGDPIPAIAILEEARAVADANGDPELRWAAREALEWSLWLAGELDVALAINDEQLAFHEMDPRIGIDIVGFSTTNSFSHRGMVLADMGRFEKAEQAFRRADDLAVGMGENELVSWNQIFRAFALVTSGDANAALALARRGIETSERIGSPVGIVGAHTAYGQALALSGDDLAAQTSLDLAIEMGRAQKVGRYHEPECLGALAEVKASLGNGTRARAVAEQAIEIAVRKGMPIAEIRARLARARVLFDIEGLQSKQEFEWELSRAEALVDSTGARAYLPQIYFERSRMAGLASDPGEQERWWGAAYGLFSELGAAGHVERMAREERA